jgi:hypothetical protein
VVSWVTWHETPYFDDRPRGRAGHDPAMLHQHLRRGRPF